MGVVGDSVKERLQYMTSYSEGTLRLAELLDEWLNTNRKEPCLTPEEKVDFTNFAIDKIRKGEF
jgi:hypothetical protein